MADEHVSLKSKVLLVASTNALLISILPILAGLYQAASWYLNVNLGWLAWAAVILPVLSVNVWLVRRKLRGPDAGTQ